MARAVGIDLGTTYSAVAYVDDYGKAVVLKNGDGLATTPSAVYIAHPHYAVGEVALQSTLVEPERVVQFIKRSMGIADHRVEIEGRAYSPEFISSIILRKIVQDASLALGEEINSAVISVPAYFSKAQRQATLDAGKLAGLNVLRIINEPTAAALSYGLARAASNASDAVQNPFSPREIWARGRQMALGKAANAPETEKPRYILVYDLGGGTFDVTILSIAPDALEVVAVGGDPRLGGKDFDDCLMNFIEAEFVLQHGVPLDPDASTEAELRLKAEAAKRQLSQRPNAIITFKIRISRPDNEEITDSIVPVKIEVSRVQLEAITAELLRRTQMCVEGVMESAGLDWSDLDEILCVGGSSRMPMVREMLLTLSGRAPLLHDPDECVAKGAALQASILSSEESSVTMSITHVLPHTLGVATLRGDDVRVEAVVPALTPLPCSNAREEFTTTVDDQTSVSVLIYEGEANAPDGFPNGPIGEFHLDMRPARPRGVPKIRVEFQCDENGHIIALARDQDTGRESRAFVHLGYARTDDEMREEMEWLSEALVA